MAENVTNKITDVFTLKKTNGVEVLYKNGVEQKCMHSQLMPVQKGFKVSGQPDVDFVQMSCNATFCPSFKMVKGVDKETGKVLYNAVSICDRTINILQEEKAEAPTMKLSK